MNFLKIVFLSVTSTVGLTQKAYTQPGKSFTLQFQNGADTLTPIMREHLWAIGREISAAAEPSFSIVCYNRKNEISRGFARGYHVITFLRDSASVPEQKLRLFYDNVGRPNMVLIRVSTKQEQSGTNCGLPRQPTIK